jgi:hypothetical protein
MADQDNLELRDKVTAQRIDGPMEFEIVGIVTNEGSDSYAVGYNDTNDDFLVFNMDGTVLQDDVLAQELFEDFVVLAEEAKH